MKTTYKLLGLHWDGMPMPSREIKTVETREPENAILASDLFGAKALEEVDMFVDVLRGNDEVAVLDDCGSKASGRVVRTFYRKRLLQARSYIQRKLPDADVLLCENRDLLACGSDKRKRRHAPVDTLVRFLQVIDGYITYLEDKGVKFDRDGSPLLDSSCFLNEWPDQIVTFKYRNSSLVTDKSRTVLLRRVGLRLDRAR